MAPITKNISVRDESGKLLEPTYPKRAKGLVKNGRARYIDENTICLLACPPRKLEDKNMSDNALNPNIQQNDTAPEPITQPMPSLEFILDSFKLIMNDTSHIHEAIYAIKEMDVNEGSSNVDGDKARGEAIKHAVLSRETTNQKMLEMLQEMYRDLKPRQEDTDAVLVKTAAELIKNIPPEFADSLWKRTLDTLNLNRCE